MIRVISPFSLINDDIKLENGKIMPLFSMSYTDTSSFGGQNLPFLVLFTGKNL
ncbi:MAG: hypothetical protein IKR46_00085 [Clostridia bacterium]|nr:hypothetical protein [Clostridia bacterium]